MYYQHDIKDVKAHLVGHSRGATFAYFFSLQQNQWRVSEAEDFLGFAKHIEYYKQLKFRKDIDQVVSLGVILPKFHSYSNIMNKLHSVVSTKDLYTSEEDKLSAQKDKNSELVKDLSHCELILDKSILPLILSWINKPVKLVRDSVLSYKHLVLPRKN